MSSREVKNSNKIAIVTTFYQSAGGISTFVRQIAEYSHKNGKSPLILSPDIHNVHQESDVIPLASYSKISVLLSLIRQLKRHDIRYIQCHGTWYLLLASVLYKHLMRLFGVKIRVVTVKHSDLTRPNVFKRYILEKIDNASDGIVFVSNYLKKRYLIEFKYKYCKPVITIYPGCRAVAVCQELKKQLILRLQPENRRPLLTYIGLFEYPGKVRGLALLLESIAILRTKKPDLMLAIAGRGNLQDEVLATITRLELQANVDLIEDLTSPYELLQISNLHCHISFQDSFPLVILEALSCGVPVLANDIGDFTSLGLEGLMVVPADAEIIANNIEKIINDKPQIDTKELFERFSWHKSTSRINDFTRTGND